MSDTPEPPAGVQPGDILVGKYRIERVLGRGGMGVVVAAHHLLLDNRVAIKFLLPEMLASQEARARFANEARAAARITSQHVARVLDVGFLETGAPYMVMELLEGVDLAHWLATHGPLTVEQAVDFLLQACAAVAEAHSLQIIHRDLKPANLFCVRGADGQLAIKVLDFGISKRSDVSASSAGMTQTRATMGTPLYMSPEQMQSARDVDARTDIWSLGVILYELLSGKSPFFGDSLPEVFVKIATADPPPLRAVRTDVPESVERIVQGCLQRDRARRFGSVRELALALRELASQGGRPSVEQISAPSGAKTILATLLPGPGESENGRVLQTILPVGQTVPATSRPHPAWLFRGLALAALLAIAGTVSLVRPTPAGPTSSFAGRGEADSESPSVALERVPAPVVTPEVDSVKSAEALPQAPSPPRAPRAPRAVRPAEGSVAILPPAASADKPPGGPAGVAAPAAPLLHAPPRCDVPYAYDAAGNKVFKRECL